MAKELMFKRILEVYDAEDGTPGEPLDVLHYHGIGGTFEDGDQPGVFTKCLRQSQLDRILLIGAQTEDGRQLGVTLLGTE